jgi:translation elongation factor EF-G
MIEAVSEFDDQLFEKFVEGHGDDRGRNLAGIRKATIALKIFPVICGSAFKNKGVQTCWTRWWIICPRRSTFRRCRRHDVDDPGR